MPQSAALEQEIDDIIRDHVTSIIQEHILAEKIPNPRWLRVNYYYCTTTIQIIICGPYGRHQRVQQLDITEPNSLDQLTQITKDLLTEITPQSH